MGDYTRIRTSGMMKHNSTSCVLRPSPYLSKPYYFIACHVTFVVKPHQDKIVSSRLGQPMIPAE